MMIKSTRLAIVAVLLSGGSVAGFLALNAGQATAAPAQTAPPPCVCSALEKLEYQPVSPAEPMARLYVGHCQCGAMSCVVTSGALQCVK